MSDTAMTLATMAALHAQCFDVPRPWSAPEIAQILQGPHAFAIQESAGFLLGRAVAGEAEILTLAVNPAARRQGIGRNLVQRFLVHAKERNAQTAFLEVAANNTAAIALYLVCGFCLSGLRRSYYQGPSGQNLDAIVMSCPL
jgi:ribosomal-protein-alanine N-acetyltransferase